MHRFVRALAIVAIANVSGWPEDSAELTGTNKLGRGNTVSICC